MNTPITTKIFFDLSVSQPQPLAEFHGGAEYTKIIFKKLIETKTTEQIFAFYFTSKDLDTHLVEDAEKHNVTLIPIASVSDLQHHINEKKPDIFYSPIPYRFHELDFGTTRFIYNIFGLRFFEIFMDPIELKYDTSIKNVIQYHKKRIFKKLYFAQKQKEYRRLLLRNNSDIVTVANHSKYALLHFFPELKDKIDNVHVLYLPRKHETQTLDTLATQDLLKKLQVKEKDYFLIVSAGRWLKNAYRAVRALDQMYQQFPELTQKTLLLGIKENHVLKKYITCKDKFIFQDYVDQTTLNTLYKNAFALLYPSLHEGFGYPPLESMGYGTPVACSAVAAIPEAYGDAALYFNPFSTDEIAMRILELTFNKTSYEKYVQAGLKRYADIAQKQDDDLDSLVKLILNRK